MDVVNYHTIESSIIVPQSAGLVKRSRPSVNIFLARITVG